MLKFKIPFINCRHHQQRNGQKSIHPPIYTIIFLSGQLSSKKIYLLPSGPFDNICFDVNHKYIKRVPILGNLVYVVCVYKNQTNSFKLPRNESLMRWKIILGGWYGERSVIDEVNPESRCTTKDHSKNDFDNLKKNFEVIVADGSITIKNYQNGEVFITCSNEVISKAHLKHMSVSSGPWNVHGELQIDKIKGMLKINSTDH